MGDASIHRFQYYKMLSRASMYEIWCMIFMYCQVSNKCIGIGNAKCPSWPLVGICWNVAMSGTQTVGPPLQIDVRLECFLFKVSSIFKGSRVRISEPESFSAGKMYAGCWKKKNNEKVPYIWLLLKPFPGFYFSDNMRRGRGTDTELKHKIEPYSHVIFACLRSSFFFFSLNRETKDGE